MRSTLLASALVLALSACHSWQHRASILAREGRLETAILQGGEFALRSWSRSARDETLFVFIDGDGLPWIERGTRIATNPTTRRLLALELAAHTPGAVLYLGRPCYFDSVATPPCIPPMWTAARYSDRIVDSMAAAIEEYAQRHAFSEVVFIGYSGGGTLSVLIAPRVRRARAVLTVAANLDTESWTKQHGYLPLDESLNPVTRPPLAHGIDEWHVIGGRDLNVPPDLNKAYWSRLPADRVWVYENADHACCWVDLWPTVLTRLRDALERSRPPAARNLSEQQAP